VSPRSRHELDAANAELERSLRRLLSEGRRRLAPASAKVLEAYDAELERHERLPRRISKPTRPPRRRSVEDFEQNLVRRFYALRKLERELHDRDEDPDFPRLLERFERRLAGQARLIAVLEILIKLLFPRPLEPPVQLARSFEDVLEDFELLLTSFDDLLDAIPAPSGRFLESSADLLEALEALLESYEDVLGQYETPSDGQLDSFEDLLRDLGRLLERFDVRVRRVRPPSPPLLERLEDLLGGNGRLIGSFANLLDHSEAYPSVTVAFQLSLARLIEQHARLIRHFSRLVNRFEVPPESLLDSLEDLLKGLLKAIGVLARIGMGGAPAIVRFVVVLIGDLEDLLHRFERLLEKLPVPSLDLVESFEDVVKGFADLLDILADMIRLAGDPDDPDFGKTLTAALDLLIESLQDLIGSLQDLKERLPEIPVPLLLSDVEALQKLQKVQEKRLKQLGAEVSLRSRSVERLADSLASELRLCHDLRGLIGREQGRAGEAFAKALARERKLAEACRRVARRVSEPSPYLRGALSDLVWLERRLASRRRARPS
jgi:hypothetical protein